MSFPALNNTSDYDVYTTKYLQSIALQIQLNQNNFDKNVGYMKTGVQDTERPDSRSIEERAGDVEKLKVQARVMLNKISDATNTNEVLDYLAKNGELLFFFIQQFPAIEKLVKEQYAGGVRAPILISLIYKRFIAQQEDSLMPESADFDIVSNMMTSQDADVLLNQTNNPELRDKLIDLARVLPSRQEIKTLFDNTAGNKDEIKFVAEMFKNSPNVSDYNSLTEEYNDAPLKDDRTNYDLEQAEEKMIQIITSFLVERTAFQEDTSNQKKMRQIDRTNLKRTTRPLPVAKDTRIARTSDQQRATTKGRRQTVEDIKAPQYMLNPTTTKISELSPAEQFKLEPRDIFSNNVLYEKRRPSSKIDKEILESVNKFKNIPKLTQDERDMRSADIESNALRRQQSKKERDAQLEEESQRFEMRKMSKADTKASQRKEEARQQERIKQIIDEMEQLKRDKKQEQDDLKALEEDKKEKEEQVQKIIAFKKKRAGNKISTFISKQRDEKKLNKLKDDIDEIEDELQEGGDNVISKSQEIQQKRDEIEIIQKRRGPDKGVRVRRTKAQMEADKAQKELAKQQKELAKQQKVSSTGKGLLNQQEQLSHRFKVLKGEILAGNTSSEVIKEMRSLVKKLVSSQELSIDQANGILKELKTL